MIRCLIVDLAPALRMGVRMVLEHAGMLVVGEAGSVQEALLLVVTKLLNPDVVVFGMNLEDGTGIKLIRELARIAPLVSGVAFSEFSDVYTVRHTMATGARAFCLKSQPADELLEGIRAAAVGLRFVSRALPPHLATQPPQRPLTPREIEVARLVCRGLPSKQIAHQLQIANETVRAHRKAAMEKLQVNNVIALARAIQSLGL